MLKKFLTCLAAPLLMSMFAGCAVAPDPTVTLDADSATLEPGAVPDTGPTPADATADLIVASAPMVLAVLNASGVDPLKVKPEQLPFYAAVCEAARTGTGLLLPDHDLLNRHGEAGCDLILQALAARPVDSAKELTPPVDATPVIEAPPEDAIPTS